MSDKKQAPRWLRRLVGRLHCRLRGFHALISFETKPGFLCTDCERTFGEETR